MSIKTSLGIEGHVQRDETELIRWTYQQMFTQ
jgi:hypothetical protein